MLSTALEDPRTRAAIVEGGRASFKPALLFMCAATGMVASTSVLTDGLWPHALGQLVLIAAWAGVYRRMLEVLSELRDTPLAERLHLAQTALYVLWLEDTAFSLDLTHPAVGTLFLMVSTVGYAFNTANFFYDAPRFLRALLVMVAGGSLLVGALGLLTVPLGGLGLGHPSALFVGKMFLTTALMAMVFSMHGNASRELRRRLDILAAQATKDALGRQERDIAARTANLLGVGAGAGMFSHDVAGPITALTLGLDEVKELARTPDEREIVANLEEAAQDIQLLAGDLVFALRGTRQVRPVAELVGLVERHLRFRQRQLPRGLQLERDLDDHALSVDALFTQALANVIVNGARFSADGRVELRGRIQPDGGYAFMVRDWGVEGDRRELALQRIREALASEGGVEADAASDTSRGVGLWLVGASVRRLGAALEARAAADGPGVELVLTFGPEDVEE